MKKLCFIVPVSLLMFTLISSCGRPERKKMPEFSYLFEPLIEPSIVSENEPFVASDTVVNSEHFFSLSATNALADSLGWRMLQSYLPLALILYDAMIKDGERGVLINLTDGGEEKYRTVLHVQLQQKFSLTVILIWDNTSRQRAIEFVNHLNKLQNFKCAFNGENKLGIAERYSTEDCFQFSDRMSTQ